MVWYRDGLCLDNGLTNLYTMINCDVTKQNESELANTVLKIQPNKADSFFCFLLVVQSFNYLYVWNQLPNLCRCFIKLKPKQYPNRKWKKEEKNHIFRLQTHFAWSHHNLKRMFFTEINFLHMCIDFNGWAYLAISNSLKTLCITISRVTPI